MSTKDKLIALYNDSSISIEEKRTVAVKLVDLYLKENSKQDFRLEKRIFDLMYDNNYYQDLIKIRNLEIKTKDIQLKKYRKESQLLALLLGIISTIAFYNIIF